MGKIREIAGVIKRAYQQIENVVRKEYTTYKSPYFSDSQWAPYNPDELQRKKGGLDIYKKMYTDDMVKASSMIKKCTMLATGYKIEPGSDDENDVKIAKKVEYDLTDGMIGNFTKSLKEILSAFDYGFSVTEIIPQIYQQGEYKGFYGIKQLKTRAPHSFEFHTDEYGNLKYILQHTDKRDIIITPELLKYFIIYSYDSEFGGWYGRSDLRSAYRPWWGKDITIRFLNIYNERFGMGIVTAKIPKTMSPTEQDTLDDMLKNIQAKTSFKIPKDVEIDLLESGKQGQSAFIQTIDKYDLMISRAILLPNLAGYGENKGGSYALGETQINLYFTILDNIRNEIEELINEQLIKRLVDWNWLNITKYPKFKFNPLSQNDKNKLTEIFLKAWELGALKATETDEEYIRGVLDFPKRTNSDVQMERPVKPFPFGNKEPAGTEPGAKSSNEETPEVETPGVEGQYAERKYQEPKLSRKLTKYEQKMNFKKLNADYISIAEKYYDKISKVVMRMKDDIESTILRKKIVENRDYDEARKIAPKYVGDLRMEFKDFLRECYTTGRKQAKAEVDKFAKKNYQLKVNWNLPPKEALAYFESKAFTLAGTERDFITKNVQQILQQGIKTGKSTNEVLYQLEEFFMKYEVVQLQSKPDGYGGWEIVEKRVEEIPGRIETIIRTNFTDAYNQARFGAFQEYSDIIPAYQYSAIMDSRTTEICEGLDENIYKADNPIWSKILPPNHFNCRSDIVPVMSDEWDGEESDPPKIMPDEEFQ